MIKYNFTLYGDEDGTWRISFPKEPICRECPLEEAFDWVRQVIGVEPDPEESERCRVIIELDLRERFVRGYWEDLAAWLIEKAKQLELLADECFRHHSCNARHQ